MWCKGSHRQFAMSETRFARQVSGAVACGAFAGLACQLRRALEPSQGCDVIRWSEWPFRRSLRGGVTTGLGGERARPGEETRRPGNQPGQPHRVRGRAQGIRVFRR